MTETKATRAFRTRWIAMLKARRGDIRSGRAAPIDQNGAKIMQSSYAIGDTSGGPPTNTVSILATRGANGELTRMIHILEDEEKSSE